MKFVIAQVGTLVNLNKVTSVEVAEGYQTWYVFANFSGEEGVRLYTGSHDDCLRYLSDLSNDLRTEGLIL